ncbi:MAG: PEP-CTERM system histidine kinase PrsK [Gammaproteobacteria bacterium]|nr:PEP-CTERM system histidine kinase PrsK [Gammaproteobacteria bacterium]
MSSAANVEVFGALGYALAGLLFLILSLWLAAVWRGRVAGSGFVSVCIVTALWGAVLAIDIAQHVMVSARGLFFEQLRFGVWAFFLIRLIAPKVSALRHAPMLVRLAAASASIFPLVGAFSIFATDYLASVFGVARVFNVLAVVAIVQSLAHLVLLEYYYRSTRLEGRWGIKLLGVAGGLIFGFDLTMYADALLFQHVDPAWWLARGYITLLAAPLLFVTAQRNPEWSMTGRISLNAAYYSAVMVIAGLYLLILSMSGYYLRAYGGELGTVIRNVTISAGLAGLAVALASGTLRARLRVFLSKHFFEYKYDYRDEWLRFIQTLASVDTGVSIQERSVRALANLMGCSAGMLWELRPDGQFESIYALDMHIAPETTEPADSSLVQFLEHWQWVVNVHELKENPAHYQGLECPSWLRETSGAWLVVPLLHQTRLTGFAVLGKPRSTPHFNWEDIDLLKTAGRQVAIHLAEAHAAQGWAQARQFEAYHRLSAYVVHDLKNLIAQLSLVVSNAKTHARNPEFMQDAIGTVGHAVSRLNRLLTQLRTPPQTDVAQITEVNIQKILAEVLDATRLRKPAPVAQFSDEPMVISSNTERLTAAVIHLVHNAQEATPENGTVEIQLARENNYAVIRIRDTGKGMDETFIRERLFKPFDSTKGLTGMGIGAFEAREVIHTLGGVMNVKSTPGQGTTFVVRLPLLK